MTPYDEISDEDLGSIAEQIGRRLPVGLAEDCARGDVLDLGESLPVMVLSLKDLAAKRGRLCERVRDTGRWHHQITCGDEVRGYASSIAPHAKDRQWRVVSVGSSELASRLDATMAWLDGQAIEDATISLLGIPSYNTVVVWLEFPDRDEIVLALGPVEHLKLQSNVRYEAQEFLKLLSSQPPALGVPTTFLDWLLHPITEVRAALDASGFGRRRPPPRPGPPPVSQPR